MKDRHYYGVRTQKDTGDLKLDRSMLQRLVISTTTSLQKQGYFAEAIGYSCVDGYQYGTMGTDAEAYAALKLRKMGLYPLDMDRRYTDHELFSLLEFFHDHVSKPTKGRNHDYYDCGMHWFQFDRTAGQNQFRQEVNAFLRDYQNGWELSENGEVQALPDPGLEPLLHDEMPIVDEDNVTRRVQSAIRKFRRYDASEEDRKDAVRDLADVLEYLRPQAEQLLTNGDERDLFNLANNFGIRHHNQKQKINYDLDVWYPWMFYYYLATIHALTRLIQRQGAPF